MKEGVKKKKKKIKKEKKRKKECIVGFLAFVLIRVTFFIFTCSFLVSAFLLNFFTLFLFFLIL